MKKILFAVALSLSTCMVFAAGTPGNGGRDDAIKLEAGLRANAIACGTPEFSAAFIENSKKVIAQSSKPDEAAQTEQAIEALVPTLVANQPKRGSLECQQFVKLTYDAAELRQVMGVTADARQLANKKWSKDDVVRVEAGLRANAIACGTPEFSATFVENSKKVIAQTSKPGEAAQIEQAIEALVPTLVANQPKRGSLECQQFIKLTYDAAELRQVMGVTADARQLANKNWNKDEVIRVEAGLRATAAACTSPQFSVSFTENSKKVIARTSKPGEAAQIEQAVEALVPTLAADQPKRDSLECRQFVRLLGDISLFRHPLGTTAQPSSQK